MLITVTARYPTSHLLIFEIWSRDSIDIELKTHHRRLTMESDADRLHYCTTSPTRPPLTLILDLQ